MLVPYIWSQATDEELWGFTNYVENFFLQFGVTPDEIIESRFSDRRPVKSSEFKNRIF